MITRRNLLVAIFAPFHARRRRRAAVIRRLLEFGRGRRLRGLRIRDLIDDGRRF